MTLPNRRRMRPRLLVSMNARGSDAPGAVRRHLARKGLGLALVLLSFGVLHMTMQPTSYRRVHASNRDRNAPARKVYCQVGRSATSGSFAVFEEPVVTDQSIPLNTASLAEGQPSSHEAGVTLARCPDLQQADWRPVVTEPSVAAPWALTNNPTASIASQHVYRAFLTTY
jgi:hypothetical protein